MKRRSRTATIGLQLALDGAELGVWSIDPITGRFENDARDRQIHGHRPGGATQDARRGANIAYIQTICRALDAAFAASARTGGSYKAEYRLAPVPGNRMQTKNAGSRSKVRSCAVPTAGHCDCSGSPATSPSANTPSKNCKRASGNPVSCLGRCPLPST